MFKLQSAAGFGGISNSFTELNIGIDASSTIDEVNGTGSWGGNQPFVVTTPTDGSDVYALHLHDQVPSAGGWACYCDLSAYGAISGETYRIIIRARHSGLTFATDGIWVGKATSTTRASIDVSTRLQLEWTDTTFTTYEWTVAYSTHPYLVVASDIATHNYGGVFLASLSFKKV